MTSKFTGSGIVATKDDAGRRVRLPIWGGPTLKGKLLRVRRCWNLGLPVAIIEYDGEKFPKATYQAALEWDDELQPTD